MSFKPDRAKAWELLRRYVPSENLQKHALAVEAVLRHFARKFGEDEEKWGVIGLLHDIDYEKYPEEHCKKCVSLLKEAGFPDDYIHAVQSHGWGICSDVEPTLPMEKVLFAIDELTGLITATALVRPSRSILDMTAKSVKKKWNEKAFSAGVDRSIIEKGAKMLGMELTDLITETIAGMQTVAKEIGLEGNPG
ncbi:MAG: HDIG domain-containing metalloprotein [Spirochaetales bacterium]